VLTVSLLVRAVNSYLFYINVAMCSDVLNLGMLDVSDCLETRLA